MPTVLLVAFTLLALPSDGQQAFAQRGQADDTRFRGQDRNNDGVITREEWRGSRQSFDIHDWNGDGVLSGDEVRVGARRSERSIEDEDFDPAVADQFTNWTETGFAALDRNRDGRVTSNEWRYDFEAFHRADRNGDGALSRTEFLGADVDDDREDRFEYLDVNGNGRIESDEWHGSADAFDWLDRNNDGVLSRAEVVGRARARSDRFAILDVNRDGRISRDEWRWSRRSFDQQDANGDGVLTRRELADTKTAAVPTSGQSVVVDAAQAWTDTGLTVREGDMVTFEAQGTARLSADPNDIAGPGGARSGRRAPDAPLRQQTAGALIARIGESTLVFVGDRRSIRAPASGRLYLGLNDDHFGDNTGEFRVTVTVQPR
jgi:Ca2+-binding EF-hand superfamily protein